MENKWYWYVARGDELMVDLDSQTLLEIALKRLQKPELPILIRDTFVTASNSPDHFHLIVRLKSRPGEMWRLLMQLYLMDHVYRSVKNFNRALCNIPGSSLLISPRNWACSGVALNSTKFWRNPDALCHCSLAKHKSQKSILSCPAHMAIRTPAPGNPWALG